MYEGRDSVEDVAVLQFTSRRASSGALPLVGMRSARNSIQTTSCLLLSHIFGNFFLFVRLVFFLICSILQVRSSLVLAVDALAN